MKAPWAAFVAASELLGGIFVAVGYVMYHVARPDTLAGWQIALGLSFAVLAGYAGVQLMRGRLSGVRASIVVQLLQVVSFTVMPVARFVALAGLRAGPVISSAGIELRLRGGGDFVAIPFARDATLAAVGTGLEFGIRIALDGLASVAFDVNVIALYFAWRLIRLLAESRSQLAESVVAAI